jgi:hypothetical protein
VGAPRLSLCTHSDSAGIAQQMAGYVKEVHMGDLSVMAAFAHLPDLYGCPGLCHLKSQSVVLCVAQQPQPAL